MKIVANNTSTNDTIFTASYILSVYANGICTMCQNLTTPQHIVWVKAHWVRIGI